MDKLGALASLIRSKNAGPFQLTFDIMFTEPKIYYRVKRSRALNAVIFADLFQIEVDEVLFVEYDSALAFKATIPRPLTQGSFGETDMFGGQQSDVLYDLEIAEEQDAPAP